MLRVLTWLLMFVATGDSSEETANEFADSGRTMTELRLPIARIVRR